MRTTIDINADLGEGFANDADLLDLVTSASISCGAHAGDRRTILGTLSAAKERGVILGAHPGYLDREHFGRVEKVVSSIDVYRLILDQFLSLAIIATEAGAVLRFVKPHGALYNQAQREEVVARGVVDVVKDLDLALLGQPGSVLERLAREAGLRFVAEGFPDRRYRADGRLVPRTEPDAILNDPAEVEAQVVRLVKGGLETLCIHGDDPRAVANATDVRKALARHAIIPQFWG